MSDGFRGWLISAEHADYDNACAAQGGSMNRREVVKLGTAAAAGLLLHASAPAQDARAPAKGASIDWAVNATIIDGCSCRMLCPCIFGSTAEVGTV